MTMYILIAVYFVSAFLSYKHVQISHSKGGIFSSLDTDFSEILLVFVPIVNTVMAVIGWCFNSPYAHNNCNSFFRIKK